MKLTSFSPTELVDKPIYWLTGIGAGLVAIYMTLLWKADDAAQLGMSGLFFLAVGSLLWDKRHKLKFKSNIFASTVGGLLLALVLWQSATLVEGDFLRMIPLISAVGLGLIASGFRGIKQYWQEILILFFLGIPQVIFSHLYDPSPITAKVSTLFLWYTGFDVINEGVFIYLPTGGVKVYEGCSGLESMTYILGLSVICLVMFPIQRNKRILTVVAAILIGFFVNAFRVVLMAVLVAYSNKEAFDYWHEGDGSLIFGMLAVFSFGAFYYFLMQQESNSTQPVDDLEKWGLK